MGASVLPRAGYGRRPGIMVKTTKAKAHPPRCIVIAGPNGAGKTTFAREFLVKEMEIARFVNADSIAEGISPLNPQLAVLAASKLFLSELDRLEGLKQDFAFESTLSGLLHANRLRRLKSIPYRVEIVFLKLDSPQLALRRVAERVKQGGHNVPKADILRRFDRGLRNFESVYRHIADSWTIYDNSGNVPLPVESGP